MASSETLKYGSIISGCVTGVFLFVWIISYFSGQHWIPSVKTRVGTICAVVTIISILTTVVFLIMYATSDNEDDEPINETESLTTVTAPATHTSVIPSTTEEPVPAPRVVRRVHPVRTVVRPASSSIQVVASEKEEEEEGKGWDGEPDDEVAEEGKGWVPELGSVSEDSSFIPIPSPVQSFQSLSPFPEEYVKPVYRPRRRM